MSDFRWSGAVPMNIAWCPRSPVSRLDGVTDELSVYWVCNVFGRCSVGTS